MTNLEVVGGGTDVCPGTIIELRAETTGDGVLSWTVGSGPCDGFTMAGGVPTLGNCFDANGNVILPVGVVDAVADVLKLRFLSGVTRTIVATHGTLDAQTSLSQTLTWRTADLTIELEPAPAGSLVISDAPAMPSLTARATGMGGAAAGVGWQVTVGLSNFTDCPPHGPPDLDTRLVATPSTGGSELALDLGGAIRGGALYISATATVNGCAVDATASVGVDGTNPTRSAIEGHAVARAQEPGIPLPPELVPALLKIACRESGQRQFDADAEGGTGFCPLFGPGGRVGIMQVPDPSAEEVWNWRANVDRAIAILGARVEEAKAYPAAVAQSQQFADRVASLNAARQQAGLPGITVSVPPFTPAQLERDAIRGYRDGWVDTDDNFDLPLHEFRLEVDAGDDLVLDGPITDQTTAADARWAQVPLADRPSAAGGPDYVDEVLAFGPSCGLMPQGSGCNVTITSTPDEMSFSPPSETGRVEVRAEIGGSIPGQTVIRWERITPAGTTGTTLFRAADGSGQPKIVYEEPIAAGQGPRVVTCQMLARKPGPGRIRASLVSGGTELCTTERDVSVPQFFHVQFVPAFNQDLAALGLRRETATSTDEQAANDAVRSLVMITIVSTTRSQFAGVNVRFTETDPAKAVTAANVTRIDIGGRDPINDFLASDLLDLGNVLIKEVRGVFPYWFTCHGTAVVPDLTDGPIYQNIFKDLATRSRCDAEETLDGTPVEPSDLTLPATTRTETITVAVKFLGRFLGTLMSHTCGHALGLVPPPPTKHNASANGNIMDDTEVLTKIPEAWTGITAFDPSTGAAAWGPFAAFTTTNRQLLEQLLPILK